MDIFTTIESLRSALSKFEKFSQLVLDQNFDENQRLFAKGVLNELCKELLTSHLEKLGGQSSSSTLNAEKQQPDATEPKRCGNCGKIKRLQKTASKVITELNVIRRFKTSISGDAHVIPKDKDETLSQRIRRKIRQIKHKYLPTLSAVPGDEHVIPKNKNETLSRRIYKDGDKTLSRMVRRKHRRYREHKFWPTLSTIPEHSVVY